MSVLGSKHKTCLKNLFLKFKINEKVLLVHCTTNYDDDNFAFVVSGPACWGDSQWQTLLAGCHALCSHDPRDDDDHLVDGDPAEDDDDHDNDHGGGDPAQDDQLDDVADKCRRGANITTNAVFALEKKRQNAEI